MVTHVRTNLNYVFDILFLLLLFLQLSDFLICLNPYFDFLSQVSGDTLLK